jgi:opacity protein-like surface antigen
MRYLKILVLPLICMCASSVLAADWSGLSIGVNHATKNLRGEWTTTETRNALGFETEPTSDTEATFKSEESGKGLRIGLNGNPGNWVFGLEAVEEEIRHEDSVDDRIPGLGNSGSDPASHVEFRASSEGVNLRLRGGYLIMPQLLFYLTAGKSELDVEVVSTCPDDANVCISGETESHSNKRTLIDTAVGLGLEYQLHGFALRAEYLEANYGHYRFTALPDQFAVSSGADAVIAIKTELMQFSLSYQF